MAKTSKPPTDFSELQDSITNALLLVHKKSGTRGVKAFLRMAVANFCAEFSGKKNPLNDPDEKMVNVLAEAIRTPVYRQ